jgi:hypothetical protein
LAFLVAVNGGAEGGAQTNPAPAQNPVPKPEPPPSPDQWKAFARQDVQAAYDVYKEQHPGMLDPANPGFPALLERARADGLEAADQADSYGTYSAALSIFSAVLNDGHAQAFALPLPPGEASQLPPVRAEWPGFLPVWRKGALVARDVGPTSPVPMGTRILACNGMPIREFVAMRLRGQLRPREEGQFWSRSPRAFYASPTSTTRARSCLFRTPDGAEREVQIPWSPAPPNWNQIFRMAIMGDRMPIGLTEPQPGIFHIALPDFQPDDEGRAAYRSLFEQLRSRFQELSRARAVILDLRHNNGGSSSWSRQVAEHLWGEKEVGEARSQYFAGTEVWWRPIEANISAMKEYAAQARQRGDIQDADSRDRFIAQLEADRAKGANFTVEKVGTLPLTARETRPRRSRLRAPVYVVTPGDCASACADALDVFTRFEAVKLIGAPSSGDSTYMDIRLQDLPSGRGRLVVPMKVWVHRPRGNGQVYEPHITMEGPDWTTAAFVAAVERDLERRKHSR